MICVLIAPLIDVKHNEEQQSRDKINDMHELLFSNGSRSRHSRSNNNNSNINNRLNANLDEEDMKIPTLNYNDSVMDGGNDDHYYRNHSRGNDNDTPQNPTIHRRENVYVHGNDDDGDDHDDIVFPLPTQKGNYFFTLVLL